MKSDEEGTIFQRPPPVWPKGMGIERPLLIPKPVKYPPVIGGYLETLCMLIVEWQLVNDPQCWVGDIKDKPKLIPYPLRDWYRRKVSEIEKKEGKR